MLHHISHQLQDELYTLIRVKKRSGIRLTRHIKLLAPVHLRGPQHSAQPPPHDADQVFPPPSVKRRLVVASAGGLEMPVPACVHPLVGSHGQDYHLVQLADGKTRHPDEVK